MRSILYIFLFLTLLYTSCKQHRQKTPIKVVEESVNGDKFVIHFTSNQNLNVLNNRKDNIYKELGSAFDFEFKDFDMDGYKDIQLYYLINIPSTEGLLTPTNAAGLRGRIVQPN